MPNIRILDEITSNQIAAGEVVERPASVVKELLENSIDAGATVINVNIQDGGLSLISVTDNGCGMDEDDAPLAFQRHATSKISKMEDLSHITTMGFRGEALPSIAAVSRVQLKTRSDVQVSGTEVEVHGGQIKSLSNVGCPAGTTIKVSDLFYNTPARRKHMKAPATEAGLISDLVNRLALARPDVSLSLSHNGRVVSRTPGSGKLLDAVAAVYGVSLAGQMLPVEDQGGFIKIRGYISAPSVHRSSRQHITVAVNGRYIRSPLVVQALQESYHTLIPTGRFPLAVILLKIEPSLIDVNVHPAKMEIKILKEQELAAQVAKTVHSLLCSSTLIPKLEKTSRDKKNNKFIQESLPLPAHKNDTYIAPAANISKPDNLSLFPQKTIELRTLARGNKADAVTIIDTVGNSVVTDYVDHKVDKGVNETPAPYIEKRAGFPVLRVVGQLAPTYILASGEDGLYIIDQHAAHERILYERFLAVYASGENCSQMLLMPITLNLAYSYSASVLKHRQLFNALGFVLEDLGGETIMLRGVPLDFPAGEEEPFFLDMVDYLSAPGRTPAKEDLVHRAAAAASCRAAVKAGARLTADVMQGLLEQLARVGNPYTCPHGRPTIINMSLRELASRFKRI